MYEMTIGDYYFQYKNPWYENDYILIYKFKKILWFYIKIKVYLTTEHYIPSSSNGCYKASVREIKTQYERAFSKYMEINKYKKEWEDFYNQENIKDKTIVELNAKIEKMKVMLEKEGIKNYDT